MIDLPSVRPTRHVTTLRETIARALLPDNLMIETNWAQALMFLEGGEESRALYLAYKGKLISGQDGKLWEDAIVEDGVPQGGPDAPHDERSREMS